MTAMDPEGKSEPVASSASSTTARETTPGGQPLTTPQQVTEKGNPVIDLTGEPSAEQTDLQRAIALSLKDTQTVSALGDISAEDQDLSRALEASLKETSSKPGTVGSSWFTRDPSNPNERKRVPSDAPVGLKNVGNTCWFSAVVQSLFHIPVFRDLVINFAPPPDVGNAAASSARDQRNLKFMQELRKLFALLVGTKRKYVDPSPAVDILKAAFRGVQGEVQSAVDSQQDISEFTHMLLEWLEEAFEVGTLATVKSEPTVKSESDFETKVKVEEATEEGKKMELKTELKMELGEDTKEETGEKTDESEKETSRIKREPSESDAVEPDSESAPVKREETKEGRRRCSSFTKKRLALDSDEKPFGKNPMVELFYGQHETDGTIEGKVFANSETFGQFPLQVEGFSDLHESLEAATAPGDIEMGGSGSGGAGSAELRPPNGPLPPLPSTPGGPRVAGGQEQWFVRLPPVIMLELSRFHFNHELGQPEKIHNRLTFPREIFLDRYMARNKEMTRKLREEAKKLKARLNILRYKLQQYIHFGGGAAAAAAAQTTAAATTTTVTGVSREEKRIPLADVLRLTLEFASTTAPPPSPTDPSSVTNEAAINAASPGGTSSPEDVPMESVESERGICDVAMTSPPPHNAEESNHEADEDENTVKPAKKMRQINSISPPAPKQISPEELFVLQNCLSRWKSEVENEVSELEEGIREVETRLSGLYEDTNLKLVPYRLHAVLVHEGKGVSTGHYWSYVREPATDSWLKYNDISVSRTTWEALCSDSEGGGGSNTASAYCLIYVNDQRDGAAYGLSEPVSSADMDTAAMPFIRRGDWRLSAEQLPIDLQRIVFEDNQVFDRELREWEAERLRPKGGETLMGRPLAQAADSTSTATASTGTRNVAGSGEGGMDHGVKPHSAAGFAHTTTTSASSTTPIMSTGTAPSTAPKPVVPSQRVGGVTRATPPPPSSSPRASSRGGSENRSTTSSPPIALVHEHAAWSNDATAKALASNSQILFRNGAFQGLIAAANVEIARLHELAEQVNNSHKRSPLFLLKYDPRLQHILVYLICNGAPKVTVVERILIEQFTVPMIEDDTLAHQFRTVVLKKIDDIKDKSSEEDLKTYWKWHQDYRTFRRLICNFNYAVDLYYKQNFQEALMYFVTIGDMNNSLVHSQESELRGLNVALLHHFRRKCVLFLNEVAIERFLSDEARLHADSVNIMQEWIIPCSVLLSLNSTQGDDADGGVVDAIREQWCNLLGTPTLGTQRVDNLQDFLSKLFDPPEQVVLKRAPDRWSTDVAEHLQEDWIRTYNLIAQHKMLDEVSRAIAKTGGGGESGNGSGGSSSGGAGGNNVESSGGHGGGQMTTGQV